MSRLWTEKSHVRFAGGLYVGGPVALRRYTLTHSDPTGDLLLTVDAECDRKRVSGWYIRFVRDEVLAA